MTTFKELNLKPEIQKSLTKLNYITPTPIQAKSIPSILEGRDLIGIAQTGTGKTASFTLPILNNMHEQYPRKLKTLIVTPTRELAAQIGENIEEYGQFLKFKHTVIFGGVKQGKQVQALEKGVDIVVATPGRLLDLLNQGMLTLKDVKYFILDEADRMLDMGFIHDIKKLLKRLPKEKQSLFFSATMSPQISSLANGLLVNPVRIEVTPQATTVEKITQKMYFVDKNCKEKLLLDILKTEKFNKVLVFTRTKHRANKVSTFLEKNNINSEPIHGNKSQNARTKALQGFKSGQVKVLVATDIAARGIDVDEISHVINFELPNEPESYVHRIGRTARAGKEGTAFSFCEAEERDYLHSIEKLIKQEIEVNDHKYHSDSAQDATGAAAKPPKKGGRGSQNNKNGRQGQNRNSSRNSSRSGSGNKRSGGNSNGPKRNSSSNRNRKR